MNREPQLDQQRNKVSIKSLAEETTIICSRIIRHSFNSRRLLSYRGPYVQSAAIMSQAASPAVVPKKGGSNTEPIRESRPAAEPTTEETAKLESATMIINEPADLIPTNNTEVPVAPTLEADTETVEKKGELCESTSTVDKESGNPPKETLMIDPRMEDAQNPPVNDKVSFRSNTGSSIQSCSNNNNYEGTAGKVFGISPNSPGAMNAKKSPPANEKVAVRIDTNDGSIQSSIKVTNVHGGKWAIQLEALRQFHAKHGHSRVPRSQGPLGTWCHHQRKQWKLFSQGKHSQITKERIDKLSELNFEFDPFVTKWRESYELLMKFKREHGHVRLPTNYTANGVNLWNWVMCQRRAYRQSQAAGKLGRINQERIDLLRAAGVVFEENPRKITDNEKFYSKLALLKKFKEEYGRNCPCPSEYVLPESGIKLGRWATVQRWRYRMHVKKGKKSSLTQDRIDALNAAGFVWDPPRKILLGLNVEGNGNKGNDGEHDDVSMCTEDEADSPPAQQQAPSHIQTDSLPGAPFAKPPPAAEVPVGAQGDSAARQVSASGTEANSVPTDVAGGEKRSAVKAEAPIPSDVTRTTATGTSISQEAMKKLHFELSCASRNRLSLPVERSLSASAGSSRNVAANTKVDFSPPKGPNMAESISSSMHEDGNEEEDSDSADPSSKTQLDQDSAQSSKPNAKKGRKNESQWNYNFNLLKAFKEEYGHCVVPRTYTIFGSTLGYWVHSQRAEYQASRNGRARSSITKERILRLESIGFDWDPIETQWRTNFNRLLQFKEKYGHFRVPHHFKYDDGDTFNLYAWVGKQRAEYKKFMDGKKSHTNQSRIDRLHAVGFDFEETPRLKVDNDRWYANLELLKQYHRDHGHWHVPKPFKVDDIPLGVWVAKQKYRAKTLRRNGDEFLMHKDRLDVLKELGVDWVPGIGRSTKAALQESIGSTMANDSASESGAPPANVGVPDDHRLSNLMEPTGAGFNGFGNALMSFAPPTANGNAVGDRMSSIHIGAPVDRRFSLPLLQTGTGFNGLGDAFLSLTAPSFRRFAMDMPSSERHPTSDSLSDWHPISREAERNGPMTTNENASFQDERILSNMEIERMVTETTQRLAPRMLGAHAAWMMNLTRGMAFEQPQHAENASHPKFAAAAAAAESARTFGRQTADSSYQTEMAPVPKSAADEITGISVTSTATSSWRRQATTFRNKTAPEEARKTDVSNAASSRQRHATALPNNSAAETAREAELATLLKKAAVDEEVSTCTSSRLSRATTPPKKAAREISTKVEEVSTSTSSWQDRTTTSTQISKSDARNEPEKANGSKGALTTESRFSRWTSLPRRPKRKKTAFQQADSSKKRKSNKEVTKTRKRRTMASDEKDDSFVSAEDMLDHFEF